MILAHIRVNNYKALLDTETEASRFVCVVGENNAGKSSLMQAVIRLLGTKPISKHEYYDPTKPVVITGIFTGVTDVDIERLHPDHREDIRGMIREGQLGLVRRYEPDGTTKQLRIITKIPKAEKFRQEAIVSAFKGVTGKDIATKLKKFYPEVTITQDPNTQKAAQSLIEAHVLSFGPDDLEDADVPLVTGIDNSIRAILPEPIYIPAVKDFSDDLQTKAGTSFGKILNILLSMIEGDLADADQLFKDLRKRLSRYVGSDGEVKDERLERVKEIESTIQKNLQESFRNIDIQLEVPPPEIKSLLSNATIYADDGVRSPIEFKGDGFKRAITFSILRAYVQLAQNPRWRKPDDTTACRDNFLFLFEEPELYLHPRAQNILFDALTRISVHHQVIVTTHSPLFFTWDAKGTFVKMGKEERAGDPKPRSVCTSVNLDDLIAKDAYQIISFETSNFGFFSKRIVLVEGESDMIAFPHMARLIDPAWDIKASNICLVQTRGKGNFKKYAKFFKRFGVPILLIGDLDLLIQDYDKIGASPTADGLRTELFRALDAIIDAENKLPDPKWSLLRDEIQRERGKRLYETLLVARKESDINKMTDIIGEIMLFERTEPKLVIMKDLARADIQALKRKLLGQLRAENVIILEKGDIEAYYPSAIAGSVDKVKRANDFCDLVNNLNDLEPLSEDIPYEGRTEKELKVICAAIMGEQINPIVSSL